MKLFVFVLSHNTFAQGGRRKTHIIDENGFCLCGGIKMGVPTREVDAYWLSQPDPDGELCKTCKRIAEKKLEVDAKHKAQERDVYITVREKSRQAALQAFKDTYGEIVGDVITDDYPDAVEFIRRYDEQMEN